MPLIALEARPMHPVETALSAGTDTNRIQSTIIAGIRETSEMARLSDVLLRRLYTDMPPRKY